MYTVESKSCLIILSLFFHLDVGKKVKTSLSFSPSNFPFQRKSSVNICVCVCACISFVNKLNLIMTSDNGGKFIGSVHLLKGSMLLKANKGKKESRHLCPLPFAGVPQRLSVSLFPPRSPSCLPPAVSPFTCLGSSPSKKDLGSIGVRVEHLQEEGFSLEDID